MYVSFWKTLIKSFCRIYIMETKTKIKLETITILKSDLEGLKDCNPNYGWKEIEKNFKENMERAKSRNLI